VLGKRCAEALAVSYARQYGVEVRIARIFNTYGPRMHENDKRVVSNFVVQALARQPLTVFGDGKQTRSFCYVSDLVEGFLRLMARGRGARAVAEGRSGSSQSEYRAGARAAGWLDAEGAAGGRAEGDGRVFPRAGCVRQRPFIWPPYNLSFGRTITFHLAEAANLLSVTTPRCSSGSS
jgi:nucleoside-diphosphate-sugar epimerase